MKTTNYPGLDYSGPGATCNRNLETGIRYGIIPANDIGQAWYDSAEPDYGEATCPKCGNAVKSAKGEYARYEHAKHECADYVCHHCKYVFGNESAYPDEPIGGQNYEGDGYKLHEDSSGDLWVFDSPYFTYAQFCSPCAPGACYLLNALESPNDANRAYCLGHDWFEDSQAPYPVYSVETGELVTPETK